MPTPQPTHLDDGKGRAGPQNGRDDEPQPQLAGADVAVEIGRAVGEGDGGGHAAHAQGGGHLRLRLMWVGVRFFLIDWGRDTHTSHINKHIHARPQ